MPDSRVLHILFTREDGATQVLQAAPGQSVVAGREQGCDVRLEGRKVSRRHLRINHNVDGRIVIIDNKSHNGTYVNGARVIEPRVLAAGDVVTAGEWDGRVDLLTPTQLRLVSPRTPPGMMPAVSLPSLGTRAITNLRNLGSPYPSNPHAFLDQPTDPANASVANRTWNWDETPEAKTQVLTSEQLRTARVEDNPIVRRITETSSSLDFRGLSDLPQLQDLDNELAPGAPSNVDTLALRLVFRVTEALSRAESMDDFLREMLEMLCDAARAKACIVLLPDDDGQLVPRVVKLRRADEKVQISRTVLEHAVRNKAALATEDAATDERFARGDSVLRFDLKAALVVPLMKETEVVGALYMTRDLPFSNTERDLVAALAQLIAMGLERSRLRDQIAYAERQKRTLERFHAPEVVRRLMMEAHAPASARGDGLFLEPLTATVLFCDLSGFTSFCEAHSAEQVGTLLNAYLGTMTEIVFSHGGTVDKYIGDAIMCIFGAPFMNEDDALRCVRCAVAMRRRFRELVRAIDGGSSAVELDVHIGVNTGTVVAGTVGSALRMEYTALGDTVNTAARLEGFARAGQILIGTTTAQLVREHVQLTSRGVVSLKGKSEAVEVFEVPDDEETSLTAPKAAGPM